MNNQQVDKVITFYRINHGFHDPYKFLLDGNFLTLLVQKEVDLRRRLHNLLTARIVISITKCILHELGILGEAYKLVLAKAN